jgi:phosphoglycolate phosphatase
MGLAVPLPGGVDAVLFDFDHTLVHLDADWDGLRKDIAEISERYGVRTDERWVLRGIGVAFRKLVDEGRDQEAARFRDEAFEHVEQVEDRALKGSRPVEGAQEVVRSLKERGYRIAIVSNNNPGSIGRALEMFGFPPVDVVVGRMRGEPVKPSPIPVMKALSRLSVSAKKAVFIGDGDADLQAGKAAGVATVLIVHNGTERDVAGKPMERIEQLGALLDFFPQRT